ncbi:MAG: 16S rRNA (guanine(966)-N(2))-methyltransferase RsmD [Candidatus Krumholzibacteriia bacterium]
MPKRSYQVRVIAGDLGGRLLTYPAAASVRPTMQRTKESVFESLGGDLAGMVVIDLYAAAGGVGIEAISRGAGRVHFVERDRSALACLRENLERCGIDARRFRVHAQDVLEFLRTPATRRIQPGVVYADPPYGATDAAVLLEFLTGIDYSPRSVLVLEHPKDVELPAPRGFVRNRLKTFGRTNVSFFVPVEGDAL